MKKIVAIAMAAVMVLSLAACGGQPTAAEQQAAENVAEAVVEEAAAPETEAVTSPQAETAAAPEIVDSSVLSDDERAAELGIPGAVVLQDTDALQGKKIGCSICYKGDEWCAALAKGLEALGAYYGADCACEDGDLNDETQTKQIENMIANNCDILMIDPITPDGSAEALNKAVDAGIPVIIYDGYWTEGEEKAETTVTWDQKSTGTITGEYFVNYVKEHNPGQKVRIVELTNAVSTHCQERFVGLHETLDAAKAAGDFDYEILNKYDSQGNRETAQNAIMAIVEPYDYVISDVDNGAMGAVSALQQVGNTDVKVFSMGAYGAEPFGLLHEKDPNYTACLNVDAWVLAQFIYEGAINYFEGKENVPTTNIALYMVDSSNVDQFWSFD